MPQISEIAKKVGAQTLCGLAHMAFGELVGGSQSVEVVGEAFSESPGDHGQSRHNQKPFCFGFRKQCLHKSSRISRHYVRDVRADMTKSIDLAIASLSARASTMESATVKNWSEAHSSSISWRIDLDSSSTCCCAS